MDRQMPDITSGFARAGKYGYKKYKKLKTFIFILLTIFLLTGCFEIKTTNPKETYKYWAGTNPPADFEFFNGQYWRSAHWTMEYIRDYIDYNYL
jgi:hypothetical protein